jgi:hypothetical protein
MCTCKPGALGQPTPNSTEAPQGGLTSRRSQGLRYLEVGKLAGVNMGRTTIFYATTELQGGVAVDQVLISVRDYPEYSEGV